MQLIFCSIFTNIANMKTKIELVIQLNTQEFDRRHSLNCFIIKLKVLFE